MIKKVLFLLLFLLFGIFVFASDIITITDNLKNNLPPQIQKCFDNSLFKFGRQIAENYDISINDKNSYEYIIKTLNKSTDIGLFYLGIFDYSLTNGFIQNLNLQDFKNVSCNNNSVLNIDYDEFKEKINKINFVIHTLITNNYKDYENISNYSSIINKYLCEFVTLENSLLISTLIKSNRLKNYAFVSSNSYDYYISDLINLNFYNNDNDNLSFFIQSGNNTLEIDNKSINAIYTENLTAGSYDINIFENGNLIFNHPVMLHKFNINFIDNLTFSPFLLKIKNNQNFIGYKVLYPFDFIFLGGYPDDLSTETDESILNRFIPGKISHIAVYLGRLSDGTAIGADFTTSLHYKKYHLRLIKLPEPFDDEFDSNLMDLPLVNVNLYKYDYCDAKRLKYDDLIKIYDNYDLIINKLKSDVISMIKYQYQFSWSFDFSDKDIYLVDDGLKNGASCVDYWLSNYEDLAGVCIKGSRIDVDGLYDYFNNDPVGQNVTLPDELNPFSFEIKFSDFVRFMNFNVYNPPPHKFSCDGTEEIGISIPNSLYLSDDLNKIEFIKKNQDI